METHDQVEHIQIPILKARIVELINAISKLPNVKLKLIIRSEVTYVNMDDMDLFTIINIWIENAIGETTNQENGKIKIEISQTEEKFTFEIRNTIVDGKSCIKSCFVCGVCSRAGCQQSASICH